MNYFCELTIQKRIDDPWYAQLLEECRQGCLSDESYNFLHGLPTEHTGSWFPNELTSCNLQACRELPEKWKQMSIKGTSWGEMQEMECNVCKKERERRNRLIADADARVQSEPFVSATYIHKNNEPKYHAMLLRAAEHAKKTRSYTLWFAAVDTPEKPMQITKNPAKLKEKLNRFLQFHDQQTCGIPGLNLLYHGLKARTTEKLVKNQKITILKHTPCTVVGWDLHPADRLREAGVERFLNYMPLCIYLKFDDTKWEVHPRLGKGML